MGVVTVLCSWEYSKTAGSNPVIFSIITTLIDTFVFGIAIEASGPISILYSLAVFLPSLAVSVRRLHDVGKSGWFLLITLIPLVGAMWIFILDCTDSQACENIYGANPKEMTDNMVVHRDVPDGPLMTTCVSRNMRMTIKPILIGITILALAGVAYYLISIGYLFRYISAQMKAGQSCMDSITEQDIPTWIDRTEKYLTNFDPTSSEVIHHGVIDPIPADLKELGIQRIDIHTGRDSVWYVWVEGGLDHTCLEVRRIMPGEYRFVAVYNDESAKIIWPKQ